MHDHMPVRAVYYTTPVFSLDPHDTYLPKVSQRLKALLFFYENSRGK